MTSVFVTLSGILSVISILPYLADVIKGKTKPRVVSWFIWSLLSGITAFAAVTDGQIPTAVLTGLGSLETLLIVILGWRYGNRHITRLDVVCLIGAFVGLGLWRMFDSPALAVITVTVIDLIGTIPTLVHSWQKPHEETWSTFVIGSIGAGFTLLATKQWQVTSYLAPVYYIVMNMAIALIIIGRKKYSVPGKPEALIEV